MSGNFEEEGIGVQRGEDDKLKKKEKTYFWSKEEDGSAIPQFNQRRWSCRNAMALKHGYAWEGKDSTTLPEVRKDDEGCPNSSGQLSKSGSKYG